MNYAVAQSLETLCSEGEVLKRVQDDKFEGKIVEVENVTPLKSPQGDNASKIIRYMLENSILKIKSVSKLSP